MGYESKLVVVKKSGLLPNKDCKDKVWAEKIAEVRLCVINYNALKKIREYPVASCYYYEHGIENEILEDFYDKELTEVPLKDMIEILKDAEAMDNYRRYKIAIGLLESFNDDDWDTNDIVVLHFGY